MRDKKKRAEATPSAVVQLARKVGANIAMARRRRRLRQHQVAARAGISRPTLARIERGELGTALGAYLSVLWALGLERGAGDLASPLTDREGATLEAARLGERVRPAGVLSDDF